MSKKEREANPDGYSLDIDAPNFSPLMYADAKQAHNRAEDAELLATILMEEYGEERSPAEIFKDAAQRQVAQAQYDAISHLESEEGERKIQQAVYDSQRRGQVTPEQENLDIYRVPRHVRQEREAREAEKEG
jgi:hypothetical protein